MKFGKSVSSGVVKEESSTTPEENAVQVTDLVKTFDNGKIRALDGVSFKVPKGQLLVIIGLSGSGKSTLLRHLNGLHLPTEGSVSVLGEHVPSLERKELRSLRRDVGFVFQQFNIVGRLTCIENVLSGALGRIWGPRISALMYSKSMRTEAIEQLERVGLADKAWQRTDTLSGGEQQRVAIARALINNPQVIIADEITGNLDEETADYVFNFFIKEIRNNKQSLIYVTHNEKYANEADMRYKISKKNIIKI